MDKIKTKHMAKRLFSTWLKNKTGYPIVPVFEIRDAQYHKEMNMFYWHVKIDRFPIKTKKGYKFKRREYYV